MSTLGADYNKTTVYIAELANPKVIHTTSISIVDPEVGFKLLATTLAHYMDNGADSLWIEKPWVNNKLAPYTGLGMTRTATFLECAAIIMHMPYHFVSPLTWRGEVFNHRKLKTQEAKEEAVKLVEEEFDYKVPTMGKRVLKPDHNFAEAVCIALYGARWKPHQD